MSYLPTGFTEEQEGTLLEAVADIQRRQKEEESRRRWTLLLGGIGALFAAVKLGIVVIPTIRKRRAERMGEL